jgi:hypothetical protein
MLEERREVEISLPIIMSIFLYFDFVIILFILINLAAFLIPIKSTIQLLFSAFFG